jgi:HAD superfamily hydrolase (TIGR01509 family)
MIASRIENMLVPGLREFLEKHRNLPMAVASNAEPENVDFLLDEAGLRPLFRAVVNGHQVSRPKPFPDVYLLAAKLLAVEPAECAVFEDSPAGTAAGAAAGMRVVGIRTTYANLPDTVLTVDNFCSRELDSWLRAQLRPVS